MVKGRGCLKGQDGQRDKTVKGSGCLKAQDG